MRTTTDNRKLAFWSHVTSRAPAVKNLQPMVFWSARVLQGERERVEAYSLSFRIVHLHLPVLEQRIERLKPLFFLLSPQPDIGEQSNPFSFCIISTCGFYIDDSIDKRVLKSATHNCLRTPDESKFDRGRRAPNRDRVLW